MIHHIAIATQNLNIMSEFYKKLPGLHWKEDKITKDGKARSVWLETKNHTLIMLEEFPYSKGPEALIFQFDPSYHLNNLPFSISKRTDYTIYFLDPDGNQLGYSSYPKRLSSKFLV